MLCALHQPRLLRSARLEFDRYWFLWNKSGALAAGQFHVLVLDLGRVDYGRGDVCDRLGAGDLHGLVFIPQILQRSEQVIPEILDLVFH